MSCFTGTNPNISAETSVISESPQKFNTKEALMKQVREDISYIKNKYSQKHLAYIKKVPRTKK